MRRLKSFVRALACLFLSMIVTVSVASAQGTISVPFNEGFVGTVGTNPQKANNITLFSEIGVTRAIFSQTVTSGSIFQIQGNDIPGTLRLTTQNGPVDVPGAIVWRWRESSSEDFSLGFVPDASISRTISYTVNGTSGTYTVNGRASDGSYAANTTNFGVALIGATLPGTGTNVSGNAALQSVLESLNAYLSALNSLKPAGPVAVTSQVTTDTTPTVTGTVTLASGESLEVTINGATYTVSTATALTLSPTGTSNEYTWSVTLPTTSTGTYNVDAVILNSGGYVLADSTSGELVIEAVAPPDITGPSGGAGAANSAISVYEEQTGVTTFAANKTVTWSISGTDAAKFQISSAGVLTYIAAPDYETPLDSGTDNVYNLRVTATDAFGNASYQDVAVTVLDLSGAVLAGTVVNGSGSAVSGVTVKLYQASAPSTVVSTAVTDANGYYSFTGLSAGDYNVEFTKSGSSPRGRTDRGTLNGRFVQSITVGAETSYTDVDGVLIDPAGVVYNSTTRAAVSGAVVRLYVTPTGGSRREVLSSELDSSGGVSGQTTGADGQYTFILNGNAPTGVYDIVVTPPSSLVFESTAIAPSSGPYVPSLGGGVEAIQTQATAPTGSQLTTYYLSFDFTITSDASTSSNGVINNHIPLDPVSAAASITKSTTDTLVPATVGETVTWTISAENTGNVALTSVSVVDTLTNASSTVTNPTATRAGTNSTDTSFDPGDTWVWTVTHTLTSGDVSSGSLENYAQLTASGPNSTSVSVYSAANGVASTASSAPTSGNGVTTTINNTSSASIKKTTTDTQVPASAGQSVSWTIEAVNTGSTTLTGVTLVDTLENGSGTALTPTVTRSGNTSGDTSFDPGDVWTWSVSYTLKATDVATGSLENYARLTASGSVDVYSGANGVVSTASTAPSTGNGVVTTIADSLSVSLEKTASSTFIASAAAGSTSMSWTIEAVNTGNATLSNVVITDTLTNGAGTASTLTATRSGATASDATFDPGDTWAWTVTYTLTQADIDSGSVENYARITASGPTSGSVSVYSASNGVASTSTSAPSSGGGVVTSIARAVTASLKKTASMTSLTSAEAGVTTIYWTIDATNTGTATLSSVNLTDTLTNGAGTATSLTVARSGDNASDTTFGPGDTWTWTASRTLTQADIDSGSIENYAQLTASGPGGTSVSVYSGANGVVSTASTAPATGNGVVTTIPTLVAAIQADLKTILRDDLQATIAQLTNATSNFVVDAMSRARDYSGGQCAALANAYVAAHPINFDTGSSAITEEAKIVISGLGELLENCDAASLIVAGHTDNIGGAAYNDALSLARAQAVIAELRLASESEVALTARGYGSGAPVASNDDELGRSANRRVEFFAIDLAEDAVCSSSVASDLSGSLDASASDIDLELQGLAEATNCETGTWSGFNWNISSDRRDGASDRDQVTLSYRRESYDPSGAVSGWFVTGYTSENEVSRLATGAIDGLGFGAGFYGARPQASGLTFDYLVALYGGRHDFNLSFQRTGGAIVADGDYDYTAVHAALGVSGQTVWFGYDVVPRLSLSGIEATASSATFTATRGSSQDLGVIGIGSVSQKRAEAEFAFTDLMPSDASSQWGVTPSLICVNQSQARGTDCGVGLSSSYSVLSQAGVDHVARIEAERYGDSRSIAVEYGYTYPIRGGSLSGGVTTSTRGSVTLQQSLDLEF